MQKLTPLNVTSLGLIGATLMACGTSNLVSPAQMQEQVAAELAGMTAPTQINIVEIDLSGGLERALPGAVRANSRYRSALASVSEFEARREGAVGALRPQASLGATAGGIREGSTARVAADTTTGLAGNINVSQLLYDGGLAAARVNEATARSMAAEWQRNATANEIASLAASAWAGLWASRERLALLNTESENLNNLIAQLERMAEGGLVDRSALDAARSSLLNMEMKRADLEQAQRSAEAAFRRYFKSVPEGPINLDDLISSTEASALCAEWDTAPELQVAAAELLAARAAAASAEAAFQPTASLRAGVTSPMNRDDSTDINLGVAINYDVTRGGARQAELEAARAREAAADANLDEAELRLKNELADLRSQLAFLQERSSVIDRQVELSEAQRADAISQITTGQSSLNQVMASGVAEYQARDTQLQLRAEIAILKYTIASRVGHLTSALSI